LHFWRVPIIITCHPELPASAALPLQPAGLLDCWLEQQSLLLMS